MRTTNTLQAGKDIDRDSITVITSPGLAATGLGDKMDPAELGACLCYYAYSTNLNPQAVTTPLIPGLASPSGKVRHISRSQSLRSVDSRKRDDGDKPRYGHLAPQTGKTVLST